MRSPPRLQSTFDRAVECIRKVLEDPAFGVLTEIDGRGGMMIVNETRTATKIVDDADVLLEFLMNFATARLRNYGHIWRERALPYWADAQPKAGAQSGAAPDRPACPQAPSFTNETPSTPRSLNSTAALQNWQQLELSPGVRAQDDFGRHLRCEMLGAPPPGQFREAKFAVNIPSARPGHGVCRRGTD